MFKLIPVTASHFDLWADHLDRIFAESGKGGSPLFSPFEALDAASLPERRKRFEGGTVKPTRQPGWIRAWGVEEDAGRLIAHLDMSGSHVPSESHRATFGIGCEKAFCRRGLGKMLMQHALEFAAGNGIEWIDLFVFGENRPAIALYQSFGFVETGRRIDRFRLAGRSVDDVMMSRRLKTC